MFLSYYLNIHFNVAYIVYYCSVCACLSSNQQTTLTIILTLPPCKVIHTGINLQITYPCYHSLLLITLTYSQSHMVLSNSHSKASLQLSIL